MIVSHNFDNAEAVAKRAFYLAWLACDGTAGAGFLQDRPGATEEEVWGNIFVKHDYPGEHVPEAGEHGVGMDADYVFGRMMKLKLYVTDNTVAFHEGSKLTADYQAWCPVYPTIYALIEEAANQLKKEAK